MCRKSMKSAVDDAPRVTRAGKSGARTRRCDTIASAAPRYERMQGSLPGGGTSGDGRVLFGEPNQFGDRTHLQLRHDVTAVYFRRLLRRPELGGNLLVRSTGDQTHGHLPLASGQHLHA